MYDLFTMKVYDGDGRKKQKQNKNTKPRKKFFPVWLPSLGGYLPECQEESVYIEEE